MEERNTTNAPSGQPTQDESEGTPQGERNEQAELKQLVAETMESNSLVTEHEPGDQSNAGAVSHIELEQAQREYMQAHAEPVVKPEERDALEAELNSPHPTGPAAMRRPPKVPLAPLKRLQPRFNPLADWANYAVVFAGGCVGTALRYLLWMAMPTAAGDGSLLMAFHPATFVANMVACFLFAALSTFCTVAIWIRKRTRQLASRGLGMGMCGGLSTLSAMMVEDITALHSGLYLGLVLYSAGTFLCGMLVSWAASVIVLRATASRSAKAMMEITPDGRAKPAIGVRVPADPAVATGAANAPAAAAADDEANPTTDEIPVVPNPQTGEVR